MRTNRRPLRTTRTRLLLPLLTRHRQAVKVCSVPGCPNLQPEAKCTDHRRAYERGRGTRQARGYDAAHDKLRAQYQQDMDAGQPYTCWRCGAHIDPTAWHLGHDDHDRSKYRGPECPPCNLATATRRISPHA